MNKFYVDTDIVPQINHYELTNMWEIFNHCHPKAVIVSHNIFIRNTLSAEYYAITLSIIYTDEN